MPRRLLVHAALALSSALLLSALSARATLGDYQTAVTNESSILSYYTFDQDDATDVVRGTNGTLMDITAFAAGPGNVGKALVLAGTGRVNLGVVEDFAFADETGSVEAWVKAGTLGAAACMFANRDGFSESRWGVHMNANKLAIGMWNGYNYRTVGIPNASTNWHHLTVVFSSGDFTVYWDGELAGSITQPLGDTDPIRATQIGSRSPWGNDSESWVGSLDEVAIYADALTAEAVQAHYQAFLLGDPPVITKQPQGGTFVPGTALTLSVKATGPQLAYQWYQGTSALGGQTTSTLSFPSLAAGNAGTYSVTVTNSAAALISSNAIVALASLPVPLVRYQAAVSNETSLISYYTFDRLLPEDVRGPNEGSLAGTADWATGVGGGAAKGLLLDGAGHVNLGAVYDFDFASGEGTVEGWFRADWTSVGYWPCLWADRDGGPTIWSIHLNPTKGTPAFYNGAGSAWYVLPGGAGTSWHHFATVFTNGTASCYVDGAMIQYPAMERTLGTGTGTTVQLGSVSATATSEGWIGMLDEVAFYSTALPAESIQAHYNAFAAGEPPVITGQPVGGYYLLGLPLQLSVAVSGSQLSYQWYKDNTAIPGATTASIGTLSLTNTHAGSYYVTITNAAGATNSAVATVFVGNDIARYQTTVLNESSLISYYTFDASDAQDSRNAHPGTVANTVAYETGPGGVTNLSLTLDGTGHIDLGQVADFDFASGSGTVEGWVRPNWDNPAPYNPSVFADRDADGSVWSVHMSQWKNEVGNFSSGYQALPIGSDGGWHHYAIAFDAGTVSMYWDGKPRGSFSQSINSSLAKTTQIGSSTPTTTSEGWMGGLDEVAFYNTALGAETIWNHFVAMVGPDEAPTISYVRSGNQLTLSWPESAVGFTPEYAETLPATSWTPVSGVVGNSVTVDITAGNRFFRLKK